MKLYIATHRHRHGSTTWPIWVNDGEPKPTPKSVAEDLGTDFEPERDECVEVEGPLDVPQPQLKFKDLPIGTIFQTRDGRVHESFTWVGLVKVSETECSRLMVSPLKMPAISGDVPVPNACPVREIVVANLRIDGSQFGSTEKIRKPRSK